MARMGLIKNIYVSWTLVITATQEAEARGQEFEASPGNVTETLSQK
jgi:hypothetical protein